jgi:hypothetical protein
MKLIIRIVFVVVFVAGCNSATLGSLTKQLTELETELIGARNADDAAAEVAAAGELRALAATAESNAGKAKTTPDIIAFYRIAATAAWQGESTNVVAVSNSGFDKCEELGLATAPTRDCFMLRVIPDLAATDKLTAQLGQATKDVKAERAKPFADRSPEVIARIGAEGDAIFDGFQNRFDGLTAAKADFADIALPDGLDELNEKNKNFVFCRMRDALAVQNLSVGSTVPEFAENQAELETIRQDHDPDNQINCAPS